MLWNELQLKIILWFITQNTLKFSSIIVLLFIPWPAWWIYHQWVFWLRQRWRLTNSSSSWHSQTGSWGRDPSWTTGWCGTLFKLHSEMGQILGWYFDFFTNVWHLYKSKSQLNQQKFSLLQFLSALFHIQVLQSRVGSGLTRKHLTMLERLTGDKHSSFSRKSVNYGQHKFFKVVPWRCEMSEGWDFVDRLRSTYVNTSCFERTYCISCKKRWRRQV